MQKKEKILIIGAGLCGTLLAIRLAQRGYQIYLIEKRPDMRKEDIGAGRSINLALSNRGLQALRLAGLEAQIQKECIPMNGRMIHDATGELRLSKYSGRANEYINSVSRGGLNMALLDEAEKYENVDALFNNTCTDVVLDRGIGIFQDTARNTTTKIHADVVIGTDGVGSAVRRSMMGRTSQLLFNYSQQFLKHGYKELSIPAAENGGYRIEKNALHIWPRGRFMIIALPNLDGSFTVTMFHPFEGEEGFNALDSKGKVLSFFQKYFPDLIAHALTLLDDYFANPVGTLGTIKCSPWQAWGKTLIMGDAAHAIVPFYGQGMNASFEDVFVFDKVLEQHAGDWTKVFKAFQDLRVHNTNAIADLAIDNFYEMQDKVADPIFIKKRKLEMQLEQQFPEYYSKYSLVTFKENISYQEAMQRGRKQDKILMEICRREERLDVQAVFKKLQKEMGY